MKKELKEFLNSEIFLKNKFVYLVIYIILFIVTVTLGCISENTKPPTKNEYKPLYEQAEKIEENFSYIVNFSNASCSIDNGNMKVKLQSEKSHFLEVTFNYSLDKIEKYEEFDNVTSFYWILFKSFFGAFFITLIVIVGMQALAYSNGVEHNK